MIPAGLELAISWFVVRRLIHWATGPMCTLIWQVCTKAFYGIFLFYYVNIFWQEHISCSMMDLSLYLWRTNTRTHVYECLIQKRYTLLNCFNCQTPSYIQFTRSIPLSCVFMRNYLGSNGSKVNKIKGRRCSISIH